MNTMIRRPQLLSSHPRSRNREDDYYSSSSLGGSNTHLFVETHLATPQSVVHRDMSSELPPLHSYSARPPRGASNNSGGKFSTTIAREERKSRKQAVSIPSKKQQLPQKYFFITRFFNEVPLTKFQYHSSS